MVDEPALGLAPVVVQEVYATLARIAQRRGDRPSRRGEFENIQCIADYVYLMENGRVVHEGTVATLLSDDRLRAVYLGA